MWGREQVSVRMTEGGQGEEEGAPMQYAGVNASNSTGIVGPA